MTTPASNNKNNVPPPLSRNRTSFIGWIIICIVSPILVVLVALDFVFYRQEIYKSLVTYLILPGFLMTGVAIIIVGAILEWRRRHRRAPGDYPALPVIDLSLAWQRRRVTFGVVLLSLLFAFSTVGIYQAYHFTESSVFCGQVCHQVMIPEYTAYQHSPHAKVSCAECHIGSGADWYVKSKLSGLRQVWAVLTHSYRLPIPTPVENLRPARETCEECHWPEKFSGSFEREIWHFSPDKTNTAIRYNLLLRVGGGTSELGGGPGHGIHWHISPQVTVRYWARDKARLDIPWVEVRAGDQPPRIYRSPDCPDPLPGNAEIRVMDCIDCHNRPSHIYRSPRQIIDVSLSDGSLSPSLPYLKRYATQVFEKQYSDTEIAMRNIESDLLEKYTDRMRGPEGRALVRSNIKWLQTLYRRNFFPEQGVNWLQYPNHIGHFEFPGCYRCHDEKHKSVQGETISNNCQLCHDFLDQAEGEKAFGPFTYKGGPFIHPRNLGDIWKGRNCTDCHGSASYATSD
ncbi:MAG: NapC/NirT family cytochrome c [bacterium]